VTIKVNNSEHILPVGFNWIQELDEVPSIHPRRFPQENSLFYRCS